MTPRTKNKPRETAGNARLRRHLRESSGLLLLASGVLLALALISYHPTDPSLNTIAGEPVRNWIGPIGASVADTLFQLLGVTSFVVAAVSLIFGGRLLIRRRFPVRWPELIGLGAIVVLVALLAQLLVGAVTFRGDALPTGGALGEILGELLTAAVGRIGALVIAACALLITLQLALDVSVSEILAWLRGPASKATRRLTDASRRGLAALASMARRGLERARARWHDLRESRARRAEARAILTKDDPLADEAFEAQSNVLRAVEQSQPDPPRIVRNDGTVAEGTPTDGPLDSADIESLEALDSVRSGEQADVAGEVAPAPPTDGERSAAVEAELTNHDADAPAPRSGGPRIVESEHLNSRPQLDVDSLRGWSPDVRFKVPPLSLLDPVPAERSVYSEDELHGNARRLESKLKDYGVEGRVVEIHPGPVITMYEFEPAPGVKISRIAGLADDLSMALKAVKVRIVAPLPGKGAVGIEVPNRQRQTVYVREVLAHDAAGIDKRALPIALGKDIVGKPTTTDLAKAPHLLIAGTTGSGKSVAVNSMLMSLLLSRTPDEVRLILIDPKMIEMSVYEHIPHLLLPVVTDPRKAAAALRWAVGEMTRRYEMLRYLKKRNITGANKSIEELQEAWDRAEQASDLPFDPEDASVPFNGRPESLPYIVIVIDELADLMMVARKDVEDGIVRLAQMARAAGIHLMIATQRPSVDVITGLIKANFPARISFKVSSKVDSRTVLDANGAEHLLGRGDMLMLKPGTSSLMRIHAPLVTVEEINRACAALREQAEPAYLENVLDGAAAGEDAAGEEAEEYDEYYDRAVAIVAETRKASTSMLQRRLKIGYNRAARIVDRMEQDGVVGPADGVKPREVFVQPFGAEV